MARSSSFSCVNCSTFFFSMVCRVSFCTVFGMRSYIQCIPYSRLFLTGCKFCCNSDKLQMKVTYINITYTGVGNSSSPTPRTRKLKIRACHFSMEKAFNKIKTPLFFKRLVFNSNHMQVFVNRLLSL